MDGFFMTQDLKPWQQVSSRYIHRESWFSLRADKLIKGNGEHMEPYYVLEYSDWVNVLPVTTDGKIVLVNQYRYGLGTFSLEVPGGIMDPHETNPLEAARRELLEETGYSCGDIIPTATVATNPATQNNRLHCFLATGCTLTHDVSLDDNEEIELVLVEVDELLHLLQTNQVIQSLHISSMLYGLMKLGKIKMG